MRIAFIVPLVLATSACASSAGFDRGALHSEVTEQVVVTEADIQRALDAKPQLPSPFRLAIEFVPAREPQYGEALWGWRQADKQVVVDAMAALKSRGIVSDAFVIDPGTVEGANNRAIRLAAAHAGADAVLVVRGAGRTDRYNNALGITYVALVTALFIPGTTTDALFVTNASLWDVRNQYLYLSSEAEGTASQTRPGAWVNERSVVSEAQADALAALAKDVAARLASMR